MCLPLSCSFICFFVCALCAVVICEWCSFSLVLPTGQVLRCRRRLCRVCHPPTSCYNFPYAQTLPHAALGTPLACQRRHSRPRQSQSGWPTASRGAMLTFSPIALSLLTLHAPPCCSGLIGLELTVRTGGQDDCVSAHELISYLLLSCSLINPPNPQLP